MIDFGSRDSKNPINPFAPPTSASPVLGLDGDENDFDSIRRQHLKQEASIKSFAILFYIGGGLLLILGLFIIVLTPFAILIGMIDGEFETFFLITMVAGCIYALIGSFQIYIAQGLQEFSVGGRKGATFFGVLGLLAFPIGTLICGYLLYRLWSEKGQFIFSPKYQDVLEATPHIV